MNEFNKNLIGLTTANDDLFFKLKFIVGEIETSLNVSEEHAAEVVVKDFMSKNNCYYNTQVTGDVFWRWKRYLEHRYITERNKGKVFGNGR